MNRPAIAVAALGVAAILPLAACGPDTQAAYRACVEKVTTGTADALDDVVDAIEAGAAPADLDLAQVRNVIDVIRSADESCGGAR